MWIFHWTKLSRHFCSMWDKLGWFHWFWQFLCERLSSFNPIGFYYSCMHGLAVYVKEGLPFAQDLSLENLVDSCLCFWQVLLHSVSYIFFLYQSPSSPLCSFLFYFIYVGSSHLLMHSSLETLISFKRTC